MADNLGVNPKTAFSSPDEGMDYPTQAKNLVYIAVKEELVALERHGTFGIDEIYVVWFAYILGGWKALVSTSLPDGRYYEVTSNKEKGETYVDIYMKLDQLVFSHT
jgi:hypothetical protein